MNNKKIQIAIDGPASSGKSTVAKLIAKKFAYIYCDTGAMYRAVTLNAINNQIDLDNEQSIVDLLQHTVIDFKTIPGGQQVFLNGKNVTETIRNEEITNSVSAVAAIKDVRSNLVKKQQKIANNGGIVMDGRDIGTTVLPNAQVKIYLVASVLERAKRRLKDNQNMGINISLDQLEKEISNRDYKDSHRKISPLRMAKDAIKIDTSSMSVEQVVNKISTIIDQKL
ncbi:cytidylate kinase [Philodulcilactobacillus myokoensis]|uniref:Cytidylate kinase n=1 Tax=Philodulcilactobacillus myokoensis TaxID=2929573 RepID=A0A9W6B1N5_9LACO|nr:(d)CMP kinase [Philodulcilactobacillus myokoensis]GLB46890.1 cytidylate kinase [Philodulcilactobacillus myokoensis]